MLTLYPFEDVSSKYKYQSVIIPEITAALNIDFDPNNLIFKVLAGILLEKKREDIKLLLNLSKKQIKYYFERVYSIIKIIHFSYRDSEEEKSITQKKVLEIYSSAKYKYVQNFSLPSLKSISIYQEEIRASDFIEGINEFIHNYGDPHQQTPENIRYPLNNSEEKAQKVDSLICTKKFVHCSEKEKKECRIKALKLLLELAEKDYCNYLGTLAKAANIFKELEAYYDVVTLANFSLKLNPDKEARAIAWEHKAKVAWKLFEKSNRTHLEFLSECLHCYTTAAACDPLDAYHPWHEVNCFLELRKFEGKCKIGANYQLRNAWKTFEKLTGKICQDSSNWSLAKPHILKTARDIVQKNPQDIWVVEVLQPWYEKNI